MTLIQTSPSELTQRHVATSPLSRDLVELDASIEPKSLPWHVLHTRSRQEKSLARVLEAADIHYELPLTERVRMYGHRKRVILEPVFTNYLFVQGPLEVTYFAQATKRVANVIEVRDQASFIRDLAQIRKALGGGAALSPYRFLTIGRRVRVTAGPFKDVEGYIEEKPKPDRLILQVEALSRAASLEIDAGLLEPVD
jgi:transcription antitermination factor NusG